MLEMLYKKSYMSYVGWFVCISPPQTHVNAVESKQITEM